MYLQSMFVEKIREIMYTLANPIISIKRCSLRGCSPHPLVNVDNFDQI